MIRNDWCQYVGNLQLRLYLKLLLYPMFYPHYLYNAVFCLTVIFPSPFTPPQPLLLNSLLWVGGYYRPLVA